jgi:ubiquinone/menaquinone biosynthesis C-methylase UbiE
MHSRIRYAFAAKFALGKRVLDIACGNGFGTVRLAEVAQSVVGADVATEAIAIAQSHFARPNVRYVHAPSEALPFSDGAFDVVVCLETVEHLPRLRQAAFVKELLRVLTTEGILVLSTPDRDVERRYELATGGYNEWHVHTPSREELDQLLGAFAHRRVYRLFDLIASVVRTESPSSEVRLADVLPRLKAGFTVVYVCASRAGGAAAAAVATFPIGFRDEPRLGSVDATMDSLPFRLRWAGNPGEAAIGSEQARRIQAGKADGPRPGSTSWWRQRALDVFVARAGGARAPAESGAPVEIADLVATTVLPDGAARVEQANLEGELPRGVATSVHISDKPDSSDATRPLVVFRGDFQWEALCTELFLAETIGDLAGFAPDDRAEILEMRLSHLDRRLSADMTRLVEQMNGIVLARDPGAAQAPGPGISLRAILRSLRGRA